jgi:hypothetical protein
VKEIEVNDDEWMRIKHKLMTSIVEEALSDYTAPVRIVHGCEYVTFERGNDDSASDH